jgi:hypothetical protein
MPPELLEVTQRESQEGKASVENENGPLPPLFPNLMKRPDALARLLVEVLGRAQIRYSFRSQLVFQFRGSASALSRAYNTPTQSNPHDQRSFRDWHPPNVISFLKPVAISAAVRSARRPRWPVQVPCRKWRYTH